MSTAHWPPSQCPWAVLTPAHGYSMLRTTPNVDYFHALYDEAKAFGIEIECHRECSGATCEVGLASLHLG